MANMIDYGMGKTNIDTTNGIRYGVISQNEVLQAWADESEPQYPCHACVEADDDGPLDDADCDFCEPQSCAYDGNGYNAECGDSGDIFLTKSPYYTRCGLCSPCAPGAGYLTDSDDDGHKAYCFGHDWFEDSSAPYRIYRVVDDTEVTT